MYEEYFCVRREIAYNLWNVLVNIGTFIQFAFSAKLCVYRKIYLQVTVLCCGMAGYGKVVFCNIAEKCLFTACRLASGRRFRNRMTIKGNNFWKFHFTLRNVVQHNFNNLYPNVKNIV